METEKPLHWNLKLYLNKTKTIIERIEEEDIFMIILIQFYQKRVSHISVGLGKQPLQICQIIFIICVSYSWSACVAGTKGPPCNFCHHLDQLSTGAGVKVGTRRGKKLGKNLNKIPAFGYDIPAELPPSSGANLF